MKDVFREAKKRHDSIEIPFELDSVVRETLSGKERANSSPKPLIYRYASVAACVLVCAIIGVGYFSMQKNGYEMTSDIEGIVVSSEKSVATPSIIHDAGNGTETLKNAKKGRSAENGIINELFSDDNILSYSVMIPSSDILLYRNINRVDGEEITLESLIGENLEYNSVNSVFYFKSRDEIVVICNGVENVIELK